MTPAVTVPTSGEPSQSSPSPCPETRPSRHRPHVRRTVPAVTVSVFGDPSQPSPSPCPENRPAVTVPLSRDPSRPSLCPGPENRPAVTVTVCKEPSRPSGLQSHPVLWRRLLALRGQIRRRNRQNELKLSNCQRTTCIVLWPLSGHSAVATYTERHEAGNTMPSG